MGSPIDREREAEILALVARGERRAALVAIMELYGAAIYAYCARTLRDDAAAQDVHQQVFFHVHRDLAGFRGDSTLWSWIARIAHNRCMDEVTRRRREQVQTVPLDDTWEPPAPDRDDPGAPSERSRRLRALERCLGRLSEPVRASVLMKYQRDLTFDELGALLGERPGTVQVRLSRALPILRRCLERAGFAL